MRTIIRFCIALAIFAIIGGLIYREQLIRKIPLDVRYYQDIVKNILTKDYKTTFLGKYPELSDKSYSLEYLLNWLGEKLTYTEESIIRYNDPIEILEYGWGRCHEFSVSFLAIMYVQGYNPRLLLDMSPPPNGDHVWIEYNLYSDVWKHLDPTQGAIYTKTNAYGYNPYINNPYIYERDWHKELNEVWAIEKDWCGRVEGNYQYEI